MTPVFAAGGAIYLYLVCDVRLGAIFSAELARSKGYSEKSGLGTGLILTVLGGDHLARRIRQGRNRGVASAQALAAAPEAARDRDGR